MRVVRACTSDLERGALARKTAGTECRDAALVLKLEAGSLIITAKAGMSKKSLMTAAIGRKLTSCAG